VRGFLNDICHPDLEMPSRTVQGDARSSFTAVLSIHPASPAVVVRVLQAQTECNEEAAPRRPLRQLVLRIRFSLLQPPTRRLSAQCSCRLCRG
jgi:hypothetical protein